MNATEATEQLLQCCPDDRAPDSPGVYALEIDVPTDAGWDTLAGNWLDYFATTPPYFARIVDCSRVLYVGEAGDVQRRINDHVAAELRQAALPAVFGVAELVDVWWHETKQSAKEAEYNRAAALDEQTPPTTYVHAR